jgi:hypothetical protein
MFSSDDTIHQRLFSPADVFTIWRIQRRELKSWILISVPACL